MVRFQNFGNFGVSVRFSTTIGQLTRRGIPLGVVRPPECEVFMGGRQT